MGGARSESDCDELWHAISVDVDNSGKLDRDQAKTLAIDFAAVDTNGDDAISNSEFMVACQNGHIKGIAAAAAHALIRRSAA